MIEERFASRRAVITGGAAGIGATIAKRIASEGGKVCVWDIDESAIDQISDQPRQYFRYTCGPDR